MMTSADFRRLALGMKGAAEGAHMGHPDFRANGRIFATLSADEQWGMVQLAPEVQAGFIEAHPNVFVPAAGAWGRGGSTMVRLELADQEVVGEAMTLAWQQSLEKSLKAKSAKKGQARPVRKTRNAPPARSRSRKKSRM